MVTEKGIMQSQTPMHINVSACKMTGKVGHSPLLLRVKPPLTALAAAFQLLCLSNLLVLLPLVIWPGTSGELFPFFLVFTRLVSSPSCVLISARVPWTDELFLASVWGAAVVEVLACDKGFHSLRPSR